MATVPTVALRTAARSLAEAVERYLDTSRSPAEWATDRGRLWQAAKDVQALASQADDPSVSVPECNERIARAVEAGREQGQADDPSGPDPTVWNIDADGVPRSPEWWDGYRAAQRYAAAALRESPDGE